MDTSPASAISLESGVGPVLAKFQDVQRIAVLRGGGLGDLIYTYPALFALRRAYPEARVTLLGTPIHAALVAATEGPVDDVEILPFAKGVRDVDEDPEALERFLQDMQGRKFDLAVQMHGGGRFSNPFLLKLGARHTVGTRTPDAERLERNLDYIYYQNEPDRWLETVGLAGAPTIIAPLVRPKPECRQDVAGLKDQARSSLVVIHPGATDPRRRWPASYFADAAASLAAEGVQVLVVGDESEKALAQEVVGLAQSKIPERDREAVRSVAGELDLGQLAALLDEATVMLASDSGPRHLAQALGTPTVGIFWVGNAFNAGARGRSLHRIHMSWVTKCPRCGADVTQVGWTAPHCGHDDTLIEGIAVADVVQDVRDLTATSLLLRG
ncbi:MULTISPECIES: glycosyltransferase family 9 protein [Paenarthrobacter]|uniref:glycosyltransferase family 9 protein n=1 Tax=Paenarthrobacter TaxID=1742992 RepID=UPI001D0C13F2|nr:MULTISPECIES: glycosyltransferase family 9 protein [Paenarthrobacter]MCX8455176.1 glycosyltransferase family 9 protein [Paenarthrobacter ureafaciens]MCY0975129.1 glycosyltransferase family 9 protein [Paenarthrobacter ureafaciens]